MVKHGALSKSHVYHLLRSNDARVRHAAFTLLERSNPRLKTNSELFVEITQFIWDANPSYDVYNESPSVILVHELISARLKIETQNKQSGAAGDLTDNTRPHVYEGGFFKRLFRRRSSRSYRKCNSVLASRGSPRPREASQGCSYHSSLIVMT